MNRRDPSHVTAWTTRRDMAIEAFALGRIQRGGLELVLDRLGYRGDALKIELLEAERARLRLKTGPEAA
jgi:hypothetical protein